MKLLIVTQVVDSEHPVLGFFHRWIEEFAKHCEVVHVICLQAGKRSLPANVHVHSLGKETGAGRLTYLWRFYKYSWQLRKEYDAVFVHMVPLYVVLGAPLWRFVFRKRVGLWYVHRQVTRSLRIAVRFVHVVYSSVPESMRVVTSKLQCVGHGMDLKNFSNIQSHESSNVCRIAHVGRITEIKNLTTLIEATAKLQLALPVEVELYGVARTQEEIIYEQKLKQLVLKYKLDTVIKFCGAIAHADLPLALAKQDITVNLTPTGGLDKAVIESAALGVPVFTTNTAFSDFFDDLAATYIIPYQDDTALAQAVEQFATLSEAEKNLIRSRFRTIAQQFDIASLIPRLCGGLSTAV